VLVVFGLMLAVQSPWRLPATIEALRDVEAGPYNARREQRGVLYTDRVFKIRKGERFQMVKVYSEGSCRIRFKSKEYDVSSCHWLEGFTDQEADIYKVISGHRSPNRPRTKP
jgi:hypothetical protein